MTADLPKDWSRGEGRGALLWLLIAWQVAFVAVCAWHEGLLGAVSALVGLYLGWGILAAVRLPAWRYRTFQSRHLPVNAPDRPGWNVALTSAVVFCLVLALWPLYWRMARLDDHRRQTRDDSHLDGARGGEGQAGG